MFAASLDPDAGLCGSERAAGDPKAAGVLLDRRHRHALFREAIGGTARQAYSHHIQRLMVTGNFALLAGVAPQEIERWYLAVYVDAFEWVEMPNTLGMAVFADGGQMAKPYAASGAYIDRMSDFCSGCVYDVKQKTGPNACPFNYLYWAFSIRQKDRLSDNPRLAMPYRTVAGWPREREVATLAEADAFLDQLDENGHRSEVGQ